MRSQKFVGLLRLMSRRPMLIFPQGPLVLLGMLARSRFFWTSVLLGAPEYGICLGCRAVSIAEFVTSLPFTV